MLKNNIIRIYKDRGVSNFYYTKLVNKINNLINHYAIPISSSEIINTDWYKHTDLLIIPGGKSNPYSKLLGNVGNEIIQKYIFNGGNYIGICAGSYYACKNIIFEKDTDDEIIKHEGNLNLINCDAFGTLNNGKYSEVNYNRVRLKYKNNIILSHYHGGNWFENIPSNVNKFKVLGKYLDFDNKSAVIKFKYGLGNVILSGIHFEIESDVNYNLFNDIFNEIYL